MGCGASKDVAEFTPFEGYVIKTKKLDDSKVFVNVFHHESVEYILYGKPKLATNKGDEKCLTYDVVINTGVCEKCANDESIKPYVSIFIL